MFGLLGFTKADAQPTLPANIPAKIEKIKLLRESYHSL